MQSGEICESGLMSRWLEHLESREILRDVVGHLENTIWSVEAYACQRRIIANSMRPSDA